jgi:5'-3' exonuclease
MGIENFHTWLKKTYPCCFLPIKSQVKYDYIYIDVNHILHHSIYGIKSREEFKEKLFSSLDLIFNNFFATKEIVLAVDGTSPYSKIILQRKRRLQGVKNINLNKISSLELTPGTELMKYVDICLGEYINILQNNYRILKPKFTLRLSNIPDEGEVKIFKQMCITDDKKGSHLVIGNDADLIVLALSCKPYYNINMLIRHLDTLELVSIKLLICAFIKNMNIKNIKDKLKYYSDIRSDFAIISIMFGNDYLPKLKYVKFEMLWEAYKTTHMLYNNTNLINNTTFNYDFLMDFMINIVDRLAPQFKKPNICEYNEKNVINYLEGLLWCLNMYQTGECSMYDYLYVGDQTVLPHDILYFVIFNKYNNMIKTPISNTLPISPSHYSLLLMPYHGKKLVPKKYHSLMDKELKYLYEKELCKKCNDYKDRLSSEHLKLKNNINSVNVILIKEDIGFISNLLTKHTKRKHKKDFDIQDIKKIVEYAKKLD